MPIQPLPTGRPRDISVTECIDPAYERVKQMLFKPFDLAKWITIGFCAWLAGLGETGGGGGGFNGLNGFNEDSHGNSHPASDFRHFYYQVRDYIVENIHWILPLAVFLIVLCLTIWLVILWLSSRGKFMFLHCVARNVAEVEVPWKKFAGAANSLFRFRVTMGLIGVGLLLPLLVGIAALIVRMLLRGEADVAGLATVLALGLGFFLLVVVFALVHKFMVDFVVPIMFLRGGTCLAAWREFIGLFTEHFWRFILYVLFQIVINIAIGVIVLMAILITCCVAGCLMALPFIGTVLLLPVLVFQRSYPLYYLAQHGAQYDVFAEPPAPGVSE